jgi:hypothetical protein
MTRTPAAAALVGIFVAASSVGRIHKGSLTDLALELLLFGLPLITPWLTLLLMERLPPMRALTLVEVGFCIGLLLYQLALPVFLQGLVETFGVFVLCGPWAIGLLATLAVLSLAAYGRWKADRNTVRAR